LFNRLLEGKSRVCFCLLHLSHGPVGQHFSFGLSFFSTVCGGPPMPSYPCNDWIFPGYKTFFLRPRKFGSLGIFSLRREPTEMLDRPPMMRRGAGKDCTSRVPRDHLFLYRGRTTRTESIIHPLRRGKRCADMDDGTPVHSLLHAPVVRRMQGWETCQGPRLRSIILLSHL